MQKVTLLPKEILIITNPLRKDGLKPFQIIFPVNIPPSRKHRFIVPKGLGKTGKVLRQQSVVPLFPIRTKSFLSLNINDTERESAIRELDNDKTYHILLEEFYPALRRTTFSLSFDVRPYTSEELPGVFETKPECLSLYEMYQLAGLYASRGENPLPVYKKAYEQFPGDIVAVLNYANALLKYGKDADGALQVLEVVREDSRVLFPMAIAYDMKGDWRKAEKLLEEAAARGCNRAKAFKAVRVNE